MAINNTTIFIIDCIMFYLAGCTQDILSTTSQRCVALKYKWRAAFLSAATALIFILVISRVISKIQVEHQVLPLVTYVIGKITGTYSSLRFLRFSEEKKE